MLKSFVLFYYCHECLLELYCFLVLLSNLEADVWNTKEIEAFQDGMTKFDKDFFRVAQHVSL